MRVAFIFLTQYKEDGNDLLERIITGDEIGSIFTSQKEKSTSKVWKTEDEAPKKFKSGPLCRWSEGLFGIVIAWYTLNLVLSP